MIAHIVEYHYTCGHVETMGYGKTYDKDAYEYTEQITLSQPCEECKVTEENVVDRSG